MGAIVGVDASIASTGLAVLTEQGAAFKRIRTFANETTIASRIGRMRESVVGITRALDRILYATPDPTVDLIVIEMPAFGKSNQGTHQLSGHWWLTVHALEKRGPIAQVATGTLKKFATGDGRAQKERVHTAAVAVFPGVPVGFREGNDVADAAVCAALGAAWLGREFGDAFASSGRDSVQSVRWPDQVKGMGA